MTVEMVVKSVAASCVREGETRPGKHASHHDQRPSTTNFIHRALYVRRLDQERTHLGGIHDKVVREHVVRRLQLCTARKVLYREREAGGRDHRFPLDLVLVYRVGEDVLPAAGERGLCVRHRKLGT